MAGIPDQVEISGGMIASPQKTKAQFKKKNIKVNTRALEPVILIFSAFYTWEELGDIRLNEWGFHMAITDESGAVIHSDYRRFGEDEPGFLEKDEETYLKYLRDEDQFQKGDGTMVRSIKTPTSPGTYTYTCQIRAMFWAREFRERKGLEKNKTESTAECKVTVTVR